MVKLCFIFVILLTATKVLCQTTNGFVNIDCGNTKNYTDPITGFVYTPDDQYIDAGIIFSIRDNYKTKIYYQTDLTLRSFPNGDRNCYSLKPVVKNNVYLVRVTFFYGNYDGLNSAKSSNPILFDLHIGVNYWRTVNVSDPGYSFEYEAITVALADYLHVCLINKGHGTPFINSLEMRSLKTSVYETYVNVSQFTDLVGRIDFGGNKVTRYPDDKYDRIWYPPNNIWTNISTSLEVDNSNSFEPPSVVLQTAILPPKSTPNASSLDLSFMIGDANPPFYAIFHFAEIQSIPNSGKREFNILLDNELLYEHMIPTYLQLFSIYSSEPLLDPKSRSDIYHLSLNSTSNSTLPPLVNGLEIFSVVQVNVAMTNLDDVEAILAIKSEYKVNKSWTGDPCAPMNYSWAGIGCTYTGDSPKITSLNLSSSGLVGSLTSSFFKLQNMKILDLSNNKLNGTIPDFLSTMTSLQVLYLSCNSFSGSVPDALQKKANAGQLTLKNDNKCKQYNNSSKKAPIAIIVSVVVTSVVVVLLLSLLFLYCKKISRDSSLEVLALVPESAIEIHEVQLKTKKYTIQEIERITDHFRKRIGQGGFGSVYAGALKDGTAVAVKTLSQTSTQGLKQFLAEAESLATLHHRNLVMLVGYCEDKKCLALVYEFMSQGSLEDHIRGDRGYGRALGWSERLHIVLEAAQGFDYLHRGCSVPIVHRDVKSSNILLGSNLEAKVSDLGLARAFSSSAKKETLATAVCGTCGYIDPEYYNTGVLTERSDVYSFGVVLMEIITGESPVMRGPTGEVNLVHYIKEKMKREDITSIIDRSFNGNYNMNALWKVMELALRCTHSTSAERPTMAEVVAELMIVEEMENSRDEGVWTDSVYSDQGNSMGFNISSANRSDMFGPAAR